MEADYFVGVAQQSLWVLALAAAPILIPILVVGVLLGMVQAATSINEQTLSFIPKLIGSFIVMILAGPWMLQMMVDYIRRLLESIPQLIG